MPDRAVLDSNVIAAVFFREDGVCKKAEITNVVWKKISLQREDMDSC